MEKIMREAMVRKDLEKLKEQGWDFEKAEGKRKVVFDTYRSNAMKGEFDYIEPFIDSGKVSIDCGANVGHYSLKLAANCRRVLAIEALEQLSWLGEALPEHCTAVFCGLGRERGEAEIQIPVSEDGQDMSGVASFVVLDDLYPNRRTQRVSIRTLDDVVEEYLPDEAIGFIKMDVEGWELPALQGAQKIIERHRPNLQVEIWPDLMPDVADAIEGMGYRGLFYFDHRVHDLSQFDHGIHTAPENDWNAERPGEFRPELHVNNFFFCPVD